MNCPACGSVHHFICTWDEKAFQALKAEAQMSDFKVGDVVFNKTLARDGIVAEPGDGQPYSPVRMVHGDIWTTGNLSLVSRPSDAKPKRGCSVACAFKSKVGDRVRMLVGPYAHQRGTVASVGSGDQFSHQYSVRLEHGGHYGFDAHELELLPPEPAQANKGLHPKYLAERAAEKARGQDLYRREFVGTWAPSEPPPTKPMTATAASTRQNINVDIDPEYTHEMDALRYMMRSLYNMEEARHSKSPLPTPDGWMPAGTHMPVKRELPRMAPLPRALLAPQNMRHKGDGFCSAIEALGIKKTNRLVCNQARSWDPMDDTFLEDA